MILNTRLLVPLAAAPALVLALSGAASAAPSSSSLGVSFTTDVAGAAKPNSNIGGVPVHFTPNTLTAKRSGSSGSTCTSAKYAFTITNTTTKAQTLTSGGRSLIKIPAKKVLGVCAFTNKPLQGTFGLAANKNAKLLIKIT